MDLTGLEGQVRIVCLTVFDVLRVLPELPVMLLVIDCCANVRPHAAWLVKCFQTVASHEGRGLPLEGKRHDHHDHQQGSKKFIHAIRTNFITFIIAKSSRPGSKGPLDVAP